MKHIILIAVVLGALFVSPAAAQEATPTPGEDERPEGAPDDLELVVDGEVAVVDVEWGDGEATIRFYASESSRVTVAGDPESSGGGAAAFHMSTYRLREDRTTEVTVSTAGDVSLWTPDSLQNDEAYQLERPSDSIIEGPYDGRDVVIAALAGATAVGFAVLFGAAKLKYAGGKRGEQVA